MAIFLLLVIFVSECECLNESSAHSPNVTAKQRSWREKYYRGMQIDHFSFQPADENKTFDLRYLVNDEWWDVNGGPILFYTGNEGAIEDFADMTGLMWDWASEFKAMLVFAEHRYYGKSLPYGNESHHSPNMAQLSVEQALADYGTLIRWIKKNVTGASNSSVIAVGGSYGGFLSAYMRLKFPHLVAGAVSSSAAILQLPFGGAPCWGYSATATRTYAEAAPGCDDAVRRVRGALTNMSSTEAGRQWIDEKFRLCNETLIGTKTFVSGERVTPMWLLVLFRSIWADLPMYNLPYASSYSRPLPAWPVKAVCAHLTSPSHDTESFLLNVQKAINIFFNYTGQLKCLNADFGAPSTSPATDRIAWGFQMCTDLIINNVCYIGGRTDFFVPIKFTSSGYSKNCYNSYRVRPRWSWLNTNYGLDHIRKSSNIIFTNGYYDPWSSGGITEDSLRGADPSLVAIEIKQGCHHYDLQASHPEDTEEIVQVRNRMKKLVVGWIKEAELNHPPTASNPVLIASHLKQNNAFTRDVAHSGGHSPPPKVTRMAGTSATFMPVIAKTIPAKLKSEKTNTQNPNIYLKRKN